MERKRLRRYLQIFVITWALDLARGSRRIVPPKTGGVKDFV